MPASLNKVQLIGNLGQNPEVRSFQNGGRVASLSVATSKKWKDKKTGEAKEVTEWHRVSVLNDSLVSFAEKYMRKGTLVYVEGALETRKYQKDGQDRYTTEIVLRPYNGELKILHSGQKGEETDAPEELQELPADMGEPLSG